MNAPWFTTGKRPRLTNEDKREWVRDSLKLSPADFGLESNRSMRRKAMALARKERKQEKPL